MSNALDDLAKRVTALEREIKRTKHEMSDYDHLNYNELAKYAGSEVGIDIFLSFLIDFLDDFGPHATRTYNRDEAANILRMIAYSKRYG